MTVTKSTSPAWRNGRMLFSCNSFGYVGKRLTTRTTASHYPHSKLARRTRVCQARPIDSARPLRRARMGEQRRVAISASAPARIALTPCRCALPSALCSALSAIPVPPGACTGSKPNGAWHGALFACRCCRHCAARLSTGHLDVVHGLIVATVGLARPVDSRLMMPRQGRKGALQRAISTTVALTTADEKNPARSGMAAGSSADLVADHTADAVRNAVGSSARLLRTTIGSSLFGSAPGGSSFLSRSLQLSHHPFLSPLVFVIAARCVQRCLPAGGLLRCSLATLVLLLNLLSFDFRSV